MFRIRKTKTASGSTAVQVVYYKNRKVIVSKHIGSSKKEEEITRLISMGESWIEKQTGQLALFEKEEQKDGIENQLQFTGVSYGYAYEILEKVAARCEMKVNKERFLFDFSIMRLIEASSKLRAIKLLDRYFDIKYSERTVYRKIVELVNEKESIETMAIKCAKEMLKEELRLVLYDVTTLYFESFKSDELRTEGFSKDNKPQQPQIVIGLITTRQGYPLSYEVFSGNTFEGKTMLEVLDNFIQKHKVNRPIVVADAAMLSRENIEELKERNFSYIVGARLANSSRKIIEEASKKLQNKDGKSLRLKTTNGDLIIEFSQKRYRKDKHEMKKQIEKAKLVVEGKLQVKRTKFAKLKNKENRYIINQDLVDKAGLLLGLKGYYTNIEPTVLANKEIIDRYHDLWHIEKTFRIAKSDLASRPIFHHKADAVKSHILICFTALMFAKFLEIKTQFSTKQIIDALWSVKQAKLFDRTNGNTVFLQSEVDNFSKDIISRVEKALSY